VKNQTDFPNYQKIIQKQQYRDDFARFHAIMLSCAEEGAERKTEMEREL
jgi:hypothetical protein